MLKEETRAVDESIQSKELFTPASITLALAKIASGNSQDYKPAKRKLLEHLDRNPQLASDESLQKAWINASRDHHLNKNGSDTNGKLDLPDKTGELDWAFEENSKFSPGALFRSLTKEDVAEAVDDTVNENELNDSIRELFLKDGAKSNPFEKLEREETSLAVADEALKDEVEIDEGLWQRIQDNPLATAIIAYGGYQIAKHGGKFVLSRMKGSAESSITSSDKVETDTNKQARSIETGKEVTVNGERALVAGTTSDGRVITRLLDYVNSTTAMDGGIPEGFEKLEGAKKEGHQREGVEFYAKKPQDKTSVLAEGDYSFLRVETTQEGRVLVLDSSEEFALVEKEKLGPPLSELEAARRQKDIASLDLKNSEQVRVGNGWGTVAGVTKDNHVIVELTGEKDANTGNPALGKEELRRNGYEPIELDVKGEAKSKAFYYRAADNPVSIHSQPELLAIEAEFMSNPENFLVVDPSEVEPIRKEGEFSEERRSIAKLNINERINGMPIDWKGAEFVQRHYGDNVVVSVPKTVLGERPASRPRDLRLYSADGGKTNAVLYRNGPWFHFANDKSGEGNSKVHVNSVSSYDSAIVGRTLYPIVADALSDNPQTEDGKRLAELKITGAKIQDPLNRDERFLSEEKDREIKYIVKDAKTQEERYSELHPGSTGQNSKNLVVYARDTASARAIAKVLDGILERESSSTPELVLDRAFKTGQVSDGRRLGLSNRVSVSRDAWPSTEIAPSNYKDAVTPNFISISLGNEVDPKKQNAVGALLETEVGEKIRSHVRDVYQNTGDLKQADLDRLSKELGIRPGMITLDTKGRIAAHANMLDIGRGDSAYMADGIKETGDLTGRNALYALYEFLHEDGQEKDPAFHQEKRELARSKEFPNKSVGETAQEVIRNTNQRLSQMAKQDLSALSSQDKLRFVSEYETSIESLERLYKEGLVEAQVELEPSKSHEKAERLSLQIDKSRESIALIQEQLQKQIEAPENSDIKQELKSKVEHLAKPNGLVDSIGRKLLSKAFILEREAQLKSRDVSFAAASVSPAASIEKFLGQTHDIKFVDRIVGAPNAELAGAAATRDLYRFLVADGNDSRLAQGVEVKFTNQVEKPSLVFSANGKEINVIAFDGAQAVDDKGNRHDYNTLETEIRIPESFRADQSKHKEIPGAVYKQLAALMVKEKATHIEVGTSVNNVVSRPGSLDQVQKQEQAILDAVQERFESKLVVHEQKLKDIARLQNVAKAEFRRQGLPEFYASTGLIELSDFNSPNDSANKRGEFAAKDYRIRLLTDAHDKDSITTHEAEHLARAQRHSRLQLAFGTEYNQLVLESSMAELGKGGLIRTPGGVTYRKDNMSSESIKEMKNLIRDFVSESKFSAGELRGLEARDVREFLDARTDGQGKIVGARSLQGEVGAMSHQDIVETMKAEIIHYAVTNYEAGFNIEPSSSAQREALALDRTLKKVGSGGLRRTASGTSVSLPRYRSPQSKAQMQELIRDYVHHSNQSGVDLKNTNFLDAKEWLEGRLESKSYSDIQRELGSIDNLARDLHVETSSFVRTKEQSPKLEPLERERQYRQLVIERALANVGRGGTRQTSSGVEARPIYANPNAAKNMEVLVHQYLFDRKGSMFDLQNLSTEQVETWLKQRQGNLPGALMSEFGNDTKKVANEIRAELVNTSIAHYETALPHSVLPEQVFRHIFEQARQMNQSVSEQIESGKIASVKDLPEVRKLTGSLSRDSVGRVSEPHYVHSRTEITARRVQLRDALQAEIWKSVNNSQIRQLIIEEGLKSVGDSAKARELGVNSPEFRKLVHEEGLKSPKVKQAIIAEGTKSNASQELIRKIQLDVKREQLDQTLELLDREPNNREHQKKAQDIARMIAKQLSQEPNLSGHGLDSMKFLVDMKLISPYDPILKNQQFGRSQNYLAGTVGYDNLPEIKFGQLNEASKQIKSDLLAITSNKGRSLESSRRQEILEKATTTALKFVTDPDLKIAEHLGLPIEFLDHRNLKVSGLDSIQGKYTIGDGVSVVGVESNNPIVTITHELGHKARWLELMALSELDPTGVRLAIMDNAVGELGKPGSIASDSIVSDRKQLVSSEAIQSYQDLVKREILTSLKEQGYDVDKEIAKLPPSKEGINPVLLREFGDSKEALAQSIEKEVAGYRESIDLLDTSKLNSSSREIVNSIKNGRAGEVVRLAMHNLVERNDRQIDAKTDLVALRQEVARLIAPEGDVTRSQITVSDKFLEKVIAENPVDIKSRDIRVAITEVATLAKKELIQHTIDGATESAGGAKPSLNTIKSLIADLNVHVSDGLIKEVMENPVEVGKLEGYELRRLIGELNGELDSRTISRSIRKRYERNGLEAPEYTDAELKKGVVDYQNRVHERMLDRMSNATTEFANNPDAKFESISVDGRTNPLVEKHIRSFTLDAVARESSGTSQLPYAISSDEIAARKPEIALRAKEVNRRLRSLPAGSDEIASLQQQQEKYVEYLKNTARQQLIHKAILNNDKRTAAGLARGFVRQLDSNVESNKPIVEWLMSHSLIERGDIRGTNLEGFFTPDGRARAVTLERMRKSSSSSFDGVKIVGDNSGVKTSTFDNPISIKDLKGRPVEVVGITATESGELKVKQKTSSLLLPLSRIWKGDFEADFKSQFGAGGIDNTNNKVSSVLDYVRLLGQEQEKGETYKSFTEARLAEKNAVNNNFHQHVANEARALVNKTWGTEVKTNDAQWSEGRRNAEAALLDHARSAAERLGLPRESIALHNIQVQKLDGAHGLYGDAMIKIDPAATDPINVLEHEVKHLQESFDRTALKQAAPELYKELIMRDCLSHVGQGGKRLSLQEVNPRPLIADKNAVQALRSLVREAITAETILSDTGSVEKWLEGKTVTPELLAEFKSKRNLAREIGLEVRHFNATMSGSTISNAIVKTAGEGGVLNEASKEYLDRKTERFRELAKSKEAFFANPEVQKLMTGVSNDAVGRADKSFYQFSIEEIRARRFQHTRQLSRLVDRGVSREALMREFPQAKFLYDDIRLGNYQEAVLLDLQKVEQGDPTGKHLESAKENAKRVLELLPRSYTSSEQAVRFMLERGIITESQAQDAGYNNVASSVQFQGNVIETEAQQRKIYMEAHTDAYFDTFEKLMDGKLAETGKLNAPKLLEDGTKEYELKRPIKANFGPLEVVEIQSILEKDGVQKVKLKFRDGKSFSYPLNESNALYSKFDGIMKTQQGKALTGEQKINLLIQHWETLERLSGLDSANKPAISQVESRQTTQPNASSVARQTTPSEIYTQAKEAGLISRELSGSLETRPEAVKEFVAFCAEQGMSKQGLVELAKLSNQSLARLANPNNLEQAKIYVSAFELGAIDGATAQEFMSEAMSKEIQLETSKGALKTSGQRAIEVLIERSMTKEGESISRESFKQLSKLSASEVVKFVQEFGNSNFDSINKLASDPKALKETLSALSQLELNDKSRTTKFQSSTGKLDLVIRSLVAEGKLTSKAIKAYDFALSRGQLTAEGLSNLLRETKDFRLIETFNESLVEQARDYERGQRSQPNNPVTSLTQESARPQDFQAGELKQGTRGDINLGRANSLEVVKENRLELEKQSLERAIERERGKGNSRTVERLEALKKDMESNERAREKLRGLAKEKACLLTSSIQEDG